MLKNNKYVKVFEDCRVVDGIFKSVICDFTRKKYYPISKQQSDFFSQIDKKSVSEVERDINRSNEYKFFFDFLLEQEMIFYCTKQELDYFPQIENQWYSSSTISNLLLFRSEKSTDNFIKQLPILDKLGLKHVQLFIEGKVNFNQLKFWIESISRISVKSIEIFISHENASPLLEEASGLSPTQIVTVTVTDSNEFKILKRNNEQLFNILFIRNAFEEVFGHNPPDPSYFNVDIRQYMEARYFNTYFNEKLIIDSNDNIIANVNDGIIENLENIDIETLVTSKDFKRPAQINKDHIEVCKDCEYRYVCNDSRTPKRVNGKWEYEQECYYNPYSGEWNLKKYE